MGVIWEYPPEVSAVLTKPPSTEGQVRREAKWQEVAKAAAEREAQWRADRDAREALRLEKERAFAWCRANGNPHLEGV